MAGVPTSFGWIVLHKFERSDCPILGIPEMALTDVALRRGMTEGIGPIASGSTRFPA
jgi:hypothetical protein